MSFKKITFFYISILIGALAMIFSCTKQEEPVTFTVPSKYRFNSPTVLSKTYYVDSLGNYIIKTKDLETFILDNEGFAQNGIGLDKIYYKNGYLLRSTGVNGFKQTYSPEGNLLFREYDNRKVIYEYTDFPNNIRQEVVNSVAIHWTFRDSYLGKFSTNLLKKVSFSDTEMNILEYSYQFDEQNRVKVMTIKRTGKFTIGSATFEYKFSY